MTNSNLDRARVENSDLYGIGLLAAVGHSVHIAYDICERAVKLRCQGCTIKRYPRDPWLP